MSCIYSLFIEIFKYACMPATNGENCLVNKIGEKVFHTHAIALYINELVEFLRMAKKCIHIFV